MTRLDHNRALFQLSQKTHAHVSQIEKFCIWGNHSSTMVPDLTHSLVNKSLATSLVDAQWIDKEFTPIVQQRGAAIIKARKLSSAASAGNAAIEHIRDWVHGGNQWQSIAVSSNGEYGVDKNLVFSYPVICKNGDWKIVEGLEMTPWVKAKFEKTLQELREEK